MFQFALRRVLFSTCVIAIVSVMIFTLMRVVPGSPATIVLGSDVSEQQIAEFDRTHGLDQPIAAQYLSWLGKALSRGDFGTSFVTGNAISPELGRVFPVTAEIVAVAFALCIALAIPLGIVSALHAGRATDRLARVFAVLGVSIPGFWLGLMLIAYGSVKLRWFPPGGLAPLSEGWWPHILSLFLPSLSLAVYYVAIITRMMRSSLLGELGRDYVRTARAMGLSPGRVIFYAVKNALIPVVSVSAMAVGYMFGWAIVIEQVFNIGGLARLLTTAIFQRDYNMVQAIVLVITLVFIVANTIADILYRLLNPKVGELS